MATTTASSASSSERHCCKRHETRDAGKVLSDSASINAEKVLVAYEKGEAFAELQERARVTLWVAVGRLYTLDMY